MAVLLAAGMTLSGSMAVFADEATEAALQEQAYAESEYTQTSEYTQQAERSGAETEDGQTSDRAAIESALDLANMDAEWTYDEAADAWGLSPVTAVTNPEIPEEQGVSVCIPAAYLVGIDTDADDEADASDGTVTGVPVIDYEAEVTSTNGQRYTAATAPVIVNTGAAGYSEQQNQTAASTYAAEGYINVACGNRGKQSTVTDEAGNTVYTGDAPSCLVDQKNAVRFVKYNILLGNLPGSVDYFVSTGGSGGGAHAVMLAATSDNPDFFDYEIAAGAVGVYRTEDGGYSTLVDINGEQTALSDGMWGCMAYSAITSLAEADMALAFEYTLDADYDFNTPFQKQLAQYLSREYMDYINEKELSVLEEAVGFDLNGDGDTGDEIALTIEYDPESHAQTGGYYGTYLDLYLAEFEQSLQDYLDRLDYAQDWTWFDEDGTALSDEAVAAMTIEEKAQAFLEGRYAKGASDSGRGGNGGFGGPDGNGGFGGPNGNGGFGGPDGNGGFGGPDGNGGFGGPDGNGGFGGPNGNGGFTGPDETADLKALTGLNGEAGADTENGAPEPAGTQELVGTPDAGTTQAAGSTIDSVDYASYEEMLAAYERDIAQIEAGDAYGNDITQLYDPTRYIGAENTNDPVWTRILMGAAEGDISMFNSLNLQLAWLMAGTDAEIEWQWDGGHVPSEILGDSLPLYVDTMYAKYGEGEEIVRAFAAQTANGSAQEATGADLTDWITYSPEEGVQFSLADAAAYRTAGAKKSIPGFDVMDYGQEDYVFGNSEQDARHWSRYVLTALSEHAKELSALWNQGA